MGASARTIGTSSKDVLHQCLGAGLRGERSVVEKLAKAWRMRRLRPLAPLLTLSARQRARSFEVQRHRARVSLRASAVRDRALQISDGDLYEQRYQVRIEQDSRAALCSTNECWHLCTLWQRIPHRRMRFASALAWPRRTSHGFSATTVNVEISMACSRCFTKCQFR